MIKLEVAKSLNASAFKSYLDSGRKPFFQKGLALIVEDITRGIIEDRAIVGGSFPALEPETIALKGHAKPLIDKGLLKDPFTYSQLNQWRSNNGQITIKSRSKGGDMPRDKVGEKLQIRGVYGKRGRKLFYFFGVSKDAADKVLMLFDDYILGALNKL